MGHGQFVECMPDAVPRDLEMPRPFGLGPLRMRGNMTAQCFPIQFTRPWRARTRVRHTAGLEPAGDAGLPHLESPSGLGLAAPTADNIHHPWTQVD